MSKKIISVMLALVLVLSAFATVAFAATSYEALDDEGKSEYTQTWALGEPVKGADGKYTVTVSLTTNYPTGAIQFQVEETDANDVIALESVALGSAIGYDAEITKNSSGLVLIIPQTSADSNLIEAEAIDGVIATLTYSYTGTGSADIAIKNDPVTEETPYGTLIAARMGNSNIVSTNFIVGQTVESTGEKRTIGVVAADPELAVKSGTIGVIDTTRTSLSDVTSDTCDGYIYGVNTDEGETVDSIFEVVGDGTMKIVPNGAGSSCGTGTMVQVLDKNENVVASYVLIIFGDIDGSGEADSDDASFIEDHAGYVYGTDESGEDYLDLGGRLAPYAAFAGDVDGSGEADSDDASFIEDHAGYVYGTDESGEDYLGLGGRITPNHVIAKLG